MPVNTSEELENRLRDSIREYQQAFSFSRTEKREKVLSVLDLMGRTPHGMRAIYQYLPELEKLDFFSGTVWEHPGRLVPYLVNGTLRSGHPNSTMEMMSELRLAAIAEQRIKIEEFSFREARQFLEEVFVLNFDLAYDEFADLPAASGERTKIRQLFGFLEEIVPLRRLKARLRETIATLVANRSVMPQRLETMLQIVEQNVPLDPSLREDEELLSYQDNFLNPTPLARKARDLQLYWSHLRQLSEEELAKEALQLGKAMVFTGLVSEHQLALVQLVNEKAPDLLPEALGLDSHGRAEFDRHRPLVRSLIQKIIRPATRSAIFGLANTLERNLFSRQIVWNAFNRLLRMDIHPEVADRLEKSNPTPHPADPIQLLVAGTLSILGHPLGVRQGGNPTCQSARGISMWSRHAPGKLINLLIDAATANNVSMRFAGDVIESAGTGEGLIRAFDHKLDAVSVVLVPHLDKIYNEMMRRATVRYLGEDPHVWVNPAFYGHWIQTGFKSAYDAITHAIKDYESFVRIFYAAFHPEYNGGHHLIYPVPLGIFITDSAANMLGFHAVSLLRIERDPDDHWRAYFFNPNSEGTQDWGQGIHPTVGGNGEAPGESSLPVEQFASRVYAYHYNQLRLGDKTEAVPATTVAKVTQLARESWGRRYHWV